VEGPYAETLRPYYRARDAYRESYAKTIKSHNLVLKVSWPETSRAKEREIIKQARALGKKEEFITGHILKVKCARDFERYSTKHIRRFLGLEQDRTRKAIHHDQS
jgi:hypothetical protein